MSEFFVSDVGSCLKF